MAKVLRLPRVSERSGLPDSSVYHEIAIGLFVPPFPLGPRKSGWLESEVDALIAARVGSVRSRGSSPCRSCLGNQWQLA